MQRLSTQGHLPGTWGRLMPSAADVQYKLCARKMLMIDRITRIDPRGGARGLGMLVGEKVLDPEHWYFPCHFKNDQVMAGSLVSDGCSQMLKVYMIYLGLHLTVDSGMEHRVEHRDLPGKNGSGEGGNGGGGGGIDCNVTFRPVWGQGNKVRCRGQIGPHKGGRTVQVRRRRLPYPWRMRSTGTSTTSRWTTRCGRAAC